MKIIYGITQMRKISKTLKAKKKTIGLVPTMGALHEGHLSLIHTGVKENNIVIVSIFVNPVQFGPKEDFNKYPRDLKRDVQLCKKEGVDIIFYPNIKEMYPGKYKTYVVVDVLSDVLCGRFRPGHFKGVATVVTKLLNIVDPDIAYFGQKDAQQGIIIKKMAEDLNMPVKIKVMPTVREEDGLAMSSRNIYLSHDERKDAVVLYQALNLARKLIKQGEKDSLGIIGKMEELINKKNSAKVQYISIVDIEDLKPVDKIKNKVLIALAVWIGKTRMIDNLIVNPNAICH
jgi:pantoate--beta-alanine ligase